MRVKRAFSKPQLSAPIPKKTWDSCRITLHTPPAFSASSTPENQPSAPFGAKKGAFSPASPANPAFLPAARPFFPPDHPAVRPGPARFPPGAPGTRRPRKTRCPGSRPRVRDFPPEAATFPRRNPARQPFSARNPAETRSPNPTRSPLGLRPPPAPPERPHQGTPAGWASPTAKVGFPASPWRSVRP